MSLVSLRVCATAMLCAVLSACGGGGSGPKPPPPAPPDQPQTIAFANAGPLSGAVATSVTNTASGGAGTGAITYSSSSTAVATVSDTGVASLLTAGTTTITATKAASAGFLSATATYTLTVTPGTQNIFLTQGGTQNVLLSAVVNNPATGGAGAGAFSYASGNPQAVTVNASGTATAVGVGTAVITVTKAGDSNYLPAQASYTLNVQTAGNVSAWIGSSSTEVHMPASANGRQFGRAAVRDCTETSPTQWNCTFGALTPVNGVAISDSVATLTTPAYYAIENNAVLGQPVVVNHRRFSERIGHGAVRFNNRYWVIGGAIPQFPRTGTMTTYLPQSDVWSSIDGRSWRLETESAAFGPRWLHQTLVHNGAIWVLSGIRQGNSGYNDVWRSTDGVSWTQITGAAPFMAITPEPNPSPINISAAVFGNAMWIVRNGKSYSSTDGLVWTQRSASIAIGGSAASRAYASLTAYNGALWYIGGGLNHVGGTATTPASGDTVDDVFRSNDGVNWTQVAPTASFGARFQHSTFVLNGRLWVMGGRSHVGGVFTERGTTYSTTDGQTWRAEALTTEMDRAYLSQAVEEPGRVTMIAGAHRSYSSKVWQTTDGSAWTELEPVAFSPRLLADGVSFNGWLWLIGGGRLDSLDTNEVWRSADGINWSRVQSSGAIFSGRSSHRVVAFNNRLWVIGGVNYFAGENGTLQYSNEVWSSPDGAAWTQHASPAFPARSAHAAVAFNNRLWVIGGTGAAGQLNDVWSSADGEMWVQETASAPFAARWGHQVVSLGNELWLLGGGRGAGEAAVGTDEIWRSTDGRSWTLAVAGARFSARTEHAATVLNGRIYVAGGASGSDYFTSAHYNDVWSSADGVTWRQEISAAPFSPRRVHTLLGLGTRLYVIGGYGVSRQHDIWRSSDGGVTWQVSFSHPITAP